MAKYGDSTKLFSNFTIGVEKQFKVFLCEYAVFTRLKIIGIKAYQVYFMLK